MEFINPFEEVEQGIPSWRLSAFHPYWHNYVCVRKIFECIRMQRKLNAVKDNPYLFVREFSKNTSPDQIQIKINERLNQCIGAMSSIKYTMETPAGIPLILDYYN